ncbi:hypothetical protein TNCV_4692461 [Trichonephila clavipes]|nr:hypothetical protein TNCV_4692461 [Trichonephila clavipes]
MVQNCVFHRQSLRVAEQCDVNIVAAVAELYRYRIVACLVTSSSPVPLKTRRVGQRWTLNLSRAETSSRCYTRAFGNGPRDLNHGRVTRTTPKLAPPVLSSTLHQREDVSALNRFNVHRSSTLHFFSDTGLELMPARIRYLHH